MIPKNLKIIIAVLFMLFGIYQFTEDFIGNGIFNRVAISDGAKMNLFSCWGAEHALTKMRARAIEPVGTQHAFIFVS